MTSLTAIMRSGLSGLNAAQTGLSVSSQNIANANTPGYVRAQVTLAPRTELGAGAGVEVAGIRRAADRFLATASHIAEAARGSAAVRSDILERAQLSFGDPSSATSVFASLDDFWSALTRVGVDPSSTLRRADVVSALERMFGDVQRIGQELQSFVAEADQRIADSISEAQSLIERVAELNAEIRLNARAGADATAAENAQSAMIDKLATLMDIRVSASPDGGVQIRTTGGALLVGIGAAQLSYTPNNGAFATPSVIRINEHLGTQSNLEPQLLGGEIKGLIEVRDRDLAGLAEALGGFSAALADALNQVHNENAASPAVSQMTGRQTGLLATDEIGFTGNAIVGLVDASGTLSQRLTVDFDAQTITAEAPAGVFSFAGGMIANFVTALNSALGAGSPAGAASFNNGVLSLNVGNNGGLVIQQDAADPSARAGRGFSHFFGLNDIVSRPAPLFFESGAAITDAHGLGAGGAITYQVRDSAGRFIAERSIAISGPLVGGTWNDLVSELNAVNTGLGQFGAFTFDGATGRIGFAADPAFQVSLISDTTQRGGTGVSFTALHGLSKAATAGRALDIDVNGALAADSARLAVARPNLGVAIGERAIEGGDNRGASALLAARDSVRSFPAAGVLGAQSTTLATYAARLGGEAGRLASDAEREEKGAVAVANAAGDRRAQIEGVSLDDELMKMTIYQNAYAAAARVVQAAQDMLDVLLALGR